jgi:hypothetical protein
MNKFYSLKAELKDDEFSPYNESITWFNATGGSDKHLELRVFLIDEYNNIVTNQLLKVKIELIFDDTGEKVPNVAVPKKNNILLFEIKKDSTFMIGKIPAVIRFRINDVSSSYQHRKFRVLVSADADTFPSIVNSISSIPILVKSKKGNAKRERDNDDVVLSNNMKVDATKKASVKSKTNVTILQ